MVDISHILDVKLERRIAIGLLYIISDKKYLEHYKTGFAKHIPGFLLPKMKPKIIDDIVQENDLIGKIAGVNIKSIDFNDEKELDGYIAGIRDIKTDGCTSLYIEDHKYISEEIINHIGNSLDMKIYKGNYIKVDHIPLVIKEIYNLLKEDLQKKELLILCKDKEVLKKMVRVISKDIKFITAVGCHKTDEEEIYEYILEETGLSLFYSSNIDKILENYGIIVNLMDGFNLDVSKIRQSCIIFDFSKQSLSKNRGKKSNVYNRIEDFVFDLENMRINEVKWINNKVHSDLYESLIQVRNHKVSYLYSGNSYYTIEEYVNSFIKLRGKL